MLSLPANFNIIATMNTSNQSLFPMDSAFKRRWDWEYVPSSNNDSNDFKIQIDDKYYKWHDFRLKINKKIKEVTESEDKQLGAFFIKTDVDKEQFKSKVMFYLWSEIFKEEYNTQNNHFRYSKTLENKPNEIVEFSFSNLYDIDDSKILEGFREIFNNKTIYVCQEYYSKKYRESTGSKQYF